jgi:hypothetical protein
MMKAFKLFLILLTVATVAVSCKKSEDFALSETIFINDPYYPGLPIYSEWGYNTFGAYIDRKPFISTQAELPAKILVNGDTLHLILKGRMSSQPVELRISIKGYAPADYFELVSLNQTTINLKDPGRALKLKIGNQQYDLSIIEGEILFNKVQKLYVDEEPTKSIISGYFRFKTFLDDEPIAVSNGRFDLGIGYDTFYNY